MNHKVTCACCGKEVRIDVERGTRKHEEYGWHYFNKIQVNMCQTDKWMWAPENTVKKEDEYLPHKTTEMCGETQVREKNKCYDPKVKPKYVEYWECDKCYNKPQSEVKLNKDIPMGRIVI